MQGDSLGCSWNLTRRVRAEWKSPNWPRPRRPGETTSRMIIAHKERAEIDVSRRGCRGCCGWRARPTRHDSCPLSVIVVAQVAASLWFRRQLATWRTLPARVTSCKFVVVAFLLLTKELLRPRPQSIVASSSPQNLLNCNAKVEKKSSFLAWKRVGPAAGLTTIWRGGRQFDWDLICRTIQNLIWCGRETLDISSRN